MKLVERDVQLVRDIALSHVLSRDQIIELGYFHSVSRVNARLRALTEEGFIQRLETPFFSQNLYASGRKARLIVGERIGALLDGRKGSPRYIQHALSVTRTRIAFTQRPGNKWRFEQQAFVQFSFDGRRMEAKPDGLVVGPSGLLAVEVDLGNVSYPKFKQKLASYSAFLRSGQCQVHWNAGTFHLLVVTTSSARVNRLLNLLPGECGFDFTCLTFADLNIPVIGPWS